MIQTTEIDQIIEDATNFRTNLKWRQREKNFRLFLYRVFLSFPISFLLLFIFGNYLIVAKILSVYLFIIIIPVFYDAYNDTADFFAKDSWEGKDMNKRYKRL